MIIIEDNFKKHFMKNTYIALGSFDGLHLGHINLINKTVKLARNNNANSMVFTFKNHPLSTINPEVSPKILMNNESKISVLKDAGLDIINMANFNEEFMKICPEDFVIHLLNNYRAKGLIVGFNYRFGYKNLGDVSLLKKMSKAHKFSLNVVDSVKYKGQVVSSSIIRTIISDEGDMKKVNKQTALEGGFFNFFKGLVIEFKRITWASKEDVKKATIAVIAFCSMYVVIVAVIDFGLNSLVKTILK